ncbi:patatin-domain-containing protein, partial [Coccomyxa subellipsoidea C-169]
PNFFASTKFFACLDLLESQELFEATQMVKMQPKEVLFRVGDDSQSGIFIVVEGRLGVYLEENDSDSLTLTNTLITGESVGDLDVLDGARRSVTCIAMEEGATLVNVSRDLFMSFIAAKPRTLQIYLHKAMARLWRVAHFVLSDFLALSLDQMPAGGLTDEFWDLLLSNQAAAAPGLKSQVSGASPLGQPVLLRRGELLHGVDQPVRQFYVLLEGNMLAERAGKGKKQESGLVGPGSVVGAAAFLSSTRSRTAVRAAGTCCLAAFGPQELEALLEEDSDAFLELLLLAARSLGPVIRRFISLGLNRVWLKAGDPAYRQGEAAESLYIIISGRLRLLREDPAARLPLTVEEEVGRGEAVGAVWALTGGYHDTTALCVRDSEFVRMSKGAFELLAQQNPRATSRMLEGMARRIAAASSARGRRRGEIVTIALVPADIHATASSFSYVSQNSLEELFGPTLHLNASTLELSFPTAFQRLHISFYRSKLTSWMAAQEEDYRFILLEADAALTPWSRICISHADCVLLVGAEEASPQVNLLEEQLVWAPMGPPSEALVLLHRPGVEPTSTAAWITPRPLLARHHHVRLSNSKDMARVARWMAGKAVGLVLSGGGSRGLAHLGVLHALDDAGVPVDVIGGTSQGAFMAALYAQGLSWERMHRVVRDYAGAMGSVRHLLSDLTLPLISVFSGAGFDRVVRESFGHGAERIEDLWLNFFCMTTNLTRGEPSVHVEGLLWKLVRASMTIVGLVPPVTEGGELLIDGGYLNNMPVDVMRGLGVDTVIVVDVEDRDDSVWHNLTPIDGGLSGWRLLWDRWCPIPALRCASLSDTSMPRYNQIVNALTWMSHSQNLRRVAREHPIDLYLQPPVTRYRLLDYHLMDRIVRDSNRCATAACFQSTVCSMQHPPCRDACIFEADVYYLGCCFSPCMVAVMVFR